MSGKGTTKMRRPHAVVGAVLAGALLAGCGGGDDTPAAKDGSKGSGAPAGSGSPSPQGPSVLLTTPAAYAPDKGWQQSLAWMPEKYSSKPPVAVGTRTDTVAYVNTTDDGYAVQVRQASTGKVLFTSKPWEPRRSLRPSFPCGKLRGTRLAPLASRPERLTR